MTTKEAKFRVSEVYQSVQGEGPRAGTPTTFVRFAGCNLRCPAWPCDTQHAIDPGLYRGEWQHLTVHELLDMIPTWPDNICFTGGEPMLQATDLLESLTWFLVRRSRPPTNARHTLEMFSNGTIPYTDQIIDRVNIVMDWKLDGSGEGTNAFGRNNQNRIDNFHRLITRKDSGYIPGDAVKFTVASEQDFQDAIDIYAEYWQGQGGWEGPEVYVGVVWGKMEEKTLVELMLDHQVPWKLNVQVHNHIWPRDQRGI